jgi:glycosyltransferase involved in cell wall biosynthesis
MVETIVDDRPVPGDDGEEGSPRRRHERTSGSDARNPRRVLMLCYYFPPISAAGTHRTVGFVRWLRRFGWSPVVLTVDKSRIPWEPCTEQVPPDVEVVRSFEWDLQKVLVVLTGLLNRIRDLFRLPRRPSPFYRWCLPDPQIAWLSTFRGALLARHCDCVYVSCSPFSSALSGCLIKIATRTPLVLDFRDAWAPNPHASRHPVRTRVLSRLEKWVVGTCDTLILNTPGAERLYRQKYPAHAHKMTCIPNGFDELNLPSEQPPGDRFVIMHVGDFYRSRKPDRLLDGLLAIGNPRIEFVQVGPVFDSYERYKDRLPIRIIDRVPHAEAMALMRSASMLYLCQGWEAGVRSDVAVASKTYEYLATGIPVLADCPPGDNAGVIRQYATRAWVPTSPDAERFAKAVTEAYASREQHRPEVSPAFAQTFNRRRLTADLAAILSAAADGAVHYSTPQRRWEGLVPCGSTAETSAD